MEPAVRQRPEPERVVTRLPRRRARNVAKLLMWSAVEQYERDGMIEDEVAEAMAELRAGILSSMGDRAYDRAELDLQSWRRRGDFP